jgi:hypothetical protein
MKPSPLDELPIHQAPLSMSRVATSDRNFYDRCYLNAHDRSGEVFLVSGLGVYPNLGVRDGYLTVKVGDLQHTLRVSDALDERVAEQAVGPLRVEVLEPLHRLRLVCESDEITADLTWHGSFPPVLEQPHLMLTGNRPTLDAQRFAQTGAWEGSLRVADRFWDVEPTLWVGTRDRSWGIRPIGEPDPGGRAAEEPMGGFWWVYAPLRFEEFQLVVLLQENPDGYRTLNDAVRIWPDGRVEQLGWPRIEFDYRSGTRHPERARLHLTTQSGEPLLVEVETLGFVALHVGCGYGGDPDWAHGQWKGRAWSSYSTYDYASGDIAGRVPWGVSDHVARAVCGDLVGYGLFEHASMGRHDPTGFADWMSVAP